MYNFNHLFEIVYIIKIKNNTKFYKKKHNNKFNSIKKKNTSLL